MNINNCIYYRDVGTVLIIAQAQNHVYRGNAMHYRLNRLPRATALPELTVTYLESYSDALTLNLTVLMLYLHIHINKAEDYSYLQYE